MSRNTTNISATIVALAGRYASVLVVFLVLVVLARRLPAHDYGIFVVTFGFAATGFYLAGLGAPDGAVRVIAEALVLGDKATAAGAIRTLVLAGFITVAFFVVVAGVAFGHAKTSWQVPFTILWIGSWSFLYIVAQGLMALGSQRAGGLFFYSAGSVSMLVTVLPYVLINSSPTGEGVILAAALGYGCASIFGFAMLLRRRLQLGLSALQSSFSVVKLCRIGAPFAATRIMTMIFLWSVPWAIAANQGPAAAGIVGTTMQLATAIGAPLAALRFALRPELIRLWALQDNQALQRLSLLVSLGAGAGAVFALIAAWAVGRPLLGFFFGPAFETAQPVLMLALVALVAEAITGVADDIVRVADFAGRVLLLQTVLIAIIVPAIFLLARNGALPAMVAYASYSFLFGVAILLWTASALRTTTSTAR